VPAERTDESNEKSLRLRSMYGCPDLGARIYELLQERGIKQARVAPELRLSPGQVSKLLNDKVDMSVGAFLHFMHRLQERPSAFLGEKNALSIELLQALRALVQIAMPVLRPAGSETTAGETRLVPLLRVAATPDNETYDDDHEPRLHALPHEYNGPDTAAFEVVGDSMIGEAILSGDVVFTRPARNLADYTDRIIVCAVQGYRHLKRLRRPRGKVVLESTEPAKNVWELNQGERASFKAIGIVIGATRRLSR